MKKIIILCFALIILSTNVDAGNYAYKIRELHPSANDKDFQLQDNSDGNGPFISFWNTGKLGPEPTLDSLDLQITDEEALEGINAFPNKKAADIVALGTRVEMQTEAANANSIPELRALVLKLAEIVYSNETGTID